jgi:hypothetical protein
MSVYGKKDCIASVNLLPGEVSKCHITSLLAYITVPSYVPCEA